MESLGGPEVRGVALDRLFRETLSPVAEGGSLREIRLMRWC